MSRGKVALRWVTLVPIALGGGLLGRAAFVVVTRIGLTWGGMVEPDSQEFAACQRQESKTWSISDRS